MKCINRFCFRIILFVSILLFSTNVFAETVTNKIEAIPDFGGGTYTGYTPATVVIPAYYNVNTRYNGKLSIIEFYINMTSGWTSWNYNKTYTITLNMATEDWRNNFMGPQVYGAQSNGNTSGSNLYVSNSFRFISYKSIKFNFKLGSTVSPYLKFRLYSGNTTSTGITGVSNWNLSSVTITAVSSSTPTPAPVTPTPRPATPTPAPDYRDIINNQTQNTQDIINNNNSNTNNIVNNQTQNTQDIIDNNTTNTSDIIENNNSNTQAIIDNDKKTNYTCYKNIFDESKSNWHQVEFDGNNRYGYQLNLETNEDYSIRSFNNPFSVVTACTGYYCTELIGDTNKTLHFHTNPFYVYFIIYRGSSNQTTAQNAFNNGNVFLQKGTYDLDSYIPPGQEYCKNKTDETNAKLDDINSSINNDDIDDNTGFFSGFQDNDHGLSSIITIPLSTIQQLTNSSCVALSVPIPFTNSNITLPCMTQVYESYIPNVYNIWKVVSFGIISYLICLDIFHIVKGFKDPNEDKVEVLDL